MSLNLDALLELPVRKRRPCLIGRTLQALPEPYNEALETLLANPAVSTATIQQRLEAAGLPGRETVIWRHRKGHCACVGGAL